MVKLPYSKEVCTQVEALEKAGVSPPGHFFQLHGCRGRALTSKIGGHAKVGGTMLVSGIYPVCKKFYFLKKCGPINYCSLVWMFSDRATNAKPNRTFEKVLRLVCKTSESKLDKLKENI